MARVLHIEDDAVNRRLVTKLLSAAGHEVIDATTGLEGVQLASVESPDLVLVDINIPDLDGYEVTLRLRSIPTLVKTPIVAITAEGDRDTSLAVGCDGFIEKPIDARGFARRIERYLNGHREMGERDSGERSLRVASQRIVLRLENKVEALLAANAKLEEMARLRREFLRNVTHELATPMTPVVGYLNLLENGDLGPMTPGQMRAVRAVGDATDRLRGVVDLLLDVSNLESGRMRFQRSEIDLVQVARGALKHANSLASSRDVELVEEPTDGRAKCIGDPDRLRRAMVHVLENAIKFSPEGGKVAVAVRALPEARQGVPMGYAFLVADDGPGIRGEHVDRVFEPFFQVDGTVTRSHQGVGLGLAFVLEVARAHGGTVRMESPPEREVAGRRATGTLVALIVSSDGLTE